MASTVDADLRELVFNAVALLICRQVAFQIAGIIAPVRGVSQLGVSAFGGQTAHEDELGQAAGVHAAAETMRVLARAGRS